MAKFHWSFLNNDYHPGVITAFQTENCFTDIQKNLGYRFVLNSAIFPEAISLNGGILPVTIKLRNEGYASPFNKRNAYIILKNLTTNQIYSLPLQADPRKWLGPNEITISENLTLPANLTAGNFKLYLSLPDEAPSLATRPEYAIRLANDNVWESISGYNSLNYTLNVTNLLGVAANSKLDLTIFPVPTQNELTIQMPNLNEYDVTVFNALGQQIKPSSSRLDNNSMTIDTHSLADGLYFVEFTKDSFQDTRKIVVKH